MTLGSSFVVALRTAALGARKWFLVSAGLGVALIVDGRIAGIDAHKVYGPALLMPFILAACFGSAAIARLRHRIGARLLDADGRGFLLAAFAWSSICLAASVATDWAASRFGLLGRAPNDLVDSIGMVFAVSALFTALVAIPAGRIDGSNGK